jgi:hypothetical protein
MQNHLNPNLHGIGLAENMHKKYKRLKLGGVDKKVGA